MSGQIFISYRREDAEGYTGRLYDRLHNRFPQNKIFMDVDGIEPGVDFVKAIEERLEACDVLVAVIGKRWLTASEGRRRRLDNPQDYVRLEIGTALKRGIRVIPVLVEGASMPPPDQLPDELKSLTRRSALNVSHDRFPADAERLTGAVERALQNARVEQQGKEKGELEHHLGEEGAGAGSEAPPSNRAPPKEDTVSLKRPWRLVVVMGIGIAICVLGFGLFKATRPRSVSIGGSSSISVNLIRC